MIRRPLPRYSLQSSINKALLAAAAPFRIFARREGRALDSVVVFRRFSACSAHLQSIAHPISHCATLQHGRNAHTSECGKKGRETKKCMCMRVPT